MHMKNTPALHRQRGIALIESLVAIVISALGILGILGMQMRTLADTSTTVRRAQAIRLIEDLSERMKVNPNALISLTSYVSAFGDTPTVGSCASGCDPATQAAYDLAVWKQTVSNSLPLGQASIFLAPGETDTTNRRQLGIMIRWRENERAGTNTDAIDATRFNDGGTWRNAGGADNTCPDNFTCHLQYLSVSGRCAPYDNGSTITFYCS